MVPLSDMGNLGEDSIIMFTTAFDLNVVNDFHFSDMETEGQRSKKFNLGRKSELVPNSGSCPNFVFSTIFAICGK